MSVLWFLPLFALLSPHSAVGQDLSVAPSVRFGPPVATAPMVTAPDALVDPASDAGAAQAFSPHAKGKTDPTALVVKTIASATTDICAAAYSFTSAPIADALLAAQARGVHVRLTLDKSQARGRHLMLTRLQAVNLPVRVNRHYAIMHDKFMVIDERVLQLGSFNYTKSAETKNAENVLVIRRYKKVIAAYQAEFDRLWDEASAPAALLPAGGEPLIEPHQVKDTIGH